MWMRFLLRLQDSINIFVNVLGLFNLLKHLFRQFDSEAECAADRGRKIQNRLSPDGGFFVIVLYLDVNDVDRAVELASPGQ